MPIMLSPAPPVHPEARDPHAFDAGTIPPADAVPLLQQMLANAIQTRALALAELDRVRALEVDKHWFVSDEQGYCAACGLPAQNGRHIARRDA
jgi:hypothetical protein